MRLQYFGHSCFRLISDTGTTIVCDPYDENMVGLTMPRTRTDVVTVSHHHADHDCTTNIVGSYALLDCKVTCACDDIAIDTIETWHDEEKGAKRGADIVFLRKIVPGGADRSYGIEVAKLAGLPEKVVQRAKVILKELEDENGVQYVAARKETDQVSLDAMSEGEVLDAIRRCQPDTLTPIEAMSLLYELKQKLSK